MFWLQQFYDMLAASGKKSFEDNFTKKSQNEHISLSAHKQKSTNYISRAFEPKIWTTNLPVSKESCTVFERIGMV